MVVKDCHLAAELSEVCFGKQLNRIKMTKIKKSLGKSVRQPLSHPDKGQAQQERSSTAGGRHRPEAS